MAFILQNSPFYIKGAEAYRIKESSWFQRLTLNIIFFLNLDKRQKENLSIESRGIASKEAKSH